MKRKLPVAPINDLGDARIARNFGMEIGVFAVKEGIHGPSTFRS
jgi:hypothetical protein